MSTFHYRRIVESASRRGLAPRHPAPPPKRGKAQEDWLRTLLPAGNHQKLLEGVSRAATVRTRVPPFQLGLKLRRFFDPLRTVPDLRAAIERGMEARRQANLAALREVAQEGDGR